LTRKRSEFEFFLEKFVSRPPYAFREDWRNNPLPWRFRNPTLGDLQRVNWAGKARHRPPWRSGHEKIEKSVRIRAASPAARSCPRGIEAHGPSMSFSRPAAGPPASMALWTCRCRNSPHLELGFGKVGTISTVDLLVRAGGIGLRVPGLHRGSKRSPVEAVPHCRIRLRPASSSCGVLGQGPGNPLPFRARAAAWFMTTHAGTPGLRAHAAVEQIAHAGERYCGSSWQGEGGPTRVRVRRASRPAARNELTWPPALARNPISGPDPLRPWDRQAARGSSRSFS